MSNKSEIVLVVAFLFLSAGAASAEITVVPNGNVAPGAAAQKSGTQSGVPDHAAAGKNSVFPQNGAGKPFGTYKQKANHDSKKQKSSRALFRTNKNDTSKWY